MPIPNTMEKAIEEQYPGENVADVLTRLIDQHRTPVKVAQVIGVYPNAVRNWMERHGYSFVPGGWKREGEPA